MITDRPPFLARFILGTIVLLICTFVGWASLAEVDEIARGDGKVIPASKTQIIQTSEAGVVQEIAVQLGQVVKRGDLLMRLDDTSTTSTLGESIAKARALSVKIARLLVEEEGDLDRDLVCPPDVLLAAPEVCQSESLHLNARRMNFRSKVSVLEERHIQRQKELDEAKANIHRIEKNLEVVRRERELLAPMVKRKLVARTELIRVERDLSENEGQEALALESIPRIEAAIKEASLQVEEVSLQMRQEALNEKTTALAELSVVNETIRGATDRVARTDIRSPVDGVVNTLEINTIGAYLQPGSVVAGIVPTSEVLLVEARISPTDVAFVRPGQAANVKVTAYDFAIYGGIDGEVENISADSLVDQNTGETFYQVRVKTGTSELLKDGKIFPIFPGMVTAVEIKTGRKTILAYLMKPVNRARSEALTER